MDPRQSAILHVLEKGEWFGGLPEDLRRAIVDRGVEVPRGALVGHDVAEDRRRHCVSEGGVVVVTPGEECFVQPDHR